MKNKKVRKLNLLAVPFCLAVYLATLTIQARGDDYSPFVALNYPQNLYWGDTHLHTVLSTDAYGYENRLTPEDAYRFAKGDSVTTNSGQKVKLSRPLDFLVISDHATFLGVFDMLENNDPVLQGTKLGEILKARQQSGELKPLGTFHLSAMGKTGLPHDPVLKETAWQRVAENAERQNDPGRFTAFIGYEWTAMPDGNNLHRNVIFRDGPGKATKVVPFSALDSRDPRALWRYLESYEIQTGGRVLAIPHNGNVSNGAMFPDKTLSGEPLSRAYAETRARWEPLYEMTQVKGDSETHPVLSPDDRFADYETWDKSNFSLEQPPKEDWMLKHEYARGALKFGLQLEKTLGVNPFKFGMIGSSDSHIGASAIEENSFFGKWAPEEPSATRLELHSYYPMARYAASGFAAVWAHENTRESLFDAMQRRETYATTGPRMVVRFFGGWDFDGEDHLRPDYVAIGYDKGVPMGGDLSRAPKGGSPRFLIVAAKDPDGANLERIQVVKGWLGEKGETHEKVYDVVLSDDRKSDPEVDMAPTIGSTVDVANATYTNRVGEAQMSAVWKDPDFEPDERAFYYVRVLEIPTPRWTTYDAAFYGTEPPEGVPAVQQERAYTSPIWYTP